MFNMGEFMVDTAIKNLKRGMMSDDTVLTYIVNYCTKGWMSEDEAQTAIDRITAIAAGEPDPADKVAEEAEEATDYRSMTVAELKALAKALGLSGYSSMSKAELIELLESVDGGGV